MPLDKMPDSEDFQLSHNSRVLHIQGNPVACIVEKNSLESEYSDLLNDLSLKAGLTGFLNKHEDLGLLLGLKLQIKTDSKFFEYTVYPNEEFVDAIIFNESISIINENLENLFTLRKLVTDQFVKTKSEFDKFKKLTS